MPPPLLGVVAVLPLIVLLITVSVPSKISRPPPSGAELPLKLLLLTVAAGGVAGNRAVGDGQRAAALDAAAQGRRAADDRERVERGPAAGADVEDLHVGAAIVAGVAADGDGMAAAIDGQGLGERERAL